MAVKVQFEIGHTSKLRSKKTPEGFTHDWDLYVQGVNKADISTFVEKVVFNLHDSFPKPKRVRKERPYSIQESGYAGFLLPIDIYFRNRDEPKRVQFTYDLDLQQTGPPKHRCETKKFIFECPSEEFRQKLLEGGGVPVSGVIGGGGVTNVTPNTMHVGGEDVMVNKPKLSSGDIISGSGSSGSGAKKHKSRTDESKASTFADLFGKPLVKSVSGGTSKHSPDGKNSSSSSNKNVGNVGGSSGSGTGSGGANTPNSNNNSSASSNLKDKIVKEKEKTGEKSTVNYSGRKEKHKQLTSPHKEGRSENKKSTSSESSISKHEKRSEEKSKKDKSRDKERERSREKGSNSSSGSLKRSFSPKSGRDVGGSSPKRAVTPSGTTGVSATVRPSSSASGRMEEGKSSTIKPEGEVVKSRDSKGKEKESNSGSSNSKKSKKDKKDKEKDKDKEKEKEKEKERDREKRDEHKEKHRILESRVKEGDRYNSNTNLSSSNTMSGAMGLLVAGEVKDSKGLSASHNNNKKNEKEVKAEIVKTKVTPEKVNDKDLGVNAAMFAANIANVGERKQTTSTSTPSSEKDKEKDKKSHKHKKKDKSKDKDKDKDKDKERDKDKDKEKEKLKEKERDRDKDKDKEKDKEREKEKLDEKLCEKPAEINLNCTPAAKATKIEGNGLPITGTTAETSTTATSGALSNVNASISTTNNKKSQNKEKKSKEKSNKEEKRQREADSESKSKQTKNSSHAVTTTSSTSAVSSCAIHTPASVPVPVPLSTSASVSTNNNNLELSDAESLHSSHDLSQSAAVPQSTTAAPSMGHSHHSDSSNSSFPDVVSKSGNRLPPPKAKNVSSSNSVSPTGKEIKSSVSNKDHKQQRNNEKNQKTVAEKAERTEKIEKEEKKRRRNSTAVNTFIEPPLKQTKREQTKSSREKSQSPSLRSGGRGGVGGVGGGSGSVSAETGGNAAFLPPPNNTNSTGTSIASSPASSSLVSSSTGHSNTNSSAALAPPLHPASPALAADAVSNVPAAASASGAATSTSNTITATNAALPTEYLSELQELHHKIMTLQDNEELQQVVEMIAATGCYEITAKTFDFDLCKLDRSTVQRLQEFFATSVS